MAKIGITHHAVERFVERHALDMTFGAARELILERAKTARRLDCRTPLGDMQWQIEDPRCILVVKRDKEGKLELGQRYRDTRARAASHGGGLVIVTVLPAEPDEDEDDEEPAALRAALQRRI